MDASPSSSMKAYVMVVFTEGYNREVFVLDRKLVIELAQTIEEGTGFNGMVNAIKRLRITHAGMGLRAAKLICEAIRDQNVEDMKGEST